MNKPTKRCRRRRTCERTALWTITGYQPTLGLTEFPTFSVFGLNVGLLACSWPWLTLNGLITVALRYFSEFGSLKKACTEIIPPWAYCKLEIL